MNENEAKIEDNVAPASDAADHADDEATGHSETGHSETGHSETGHSEASSKPAAGSGPVNLCEDAVREELKKVIDPELFVNIVDLGLVYVVDLQPGDQGQHKVTIDMTMTSPACPAGPQLIAQTKHFVSQMPGVAEVEVKIVMDPPWTPDCMTEDARDQLGIF